MKETQNDILNSFTLEHAKAWEAAPEKNIWLCETFNLQPREHRIDDSDALESILIAVKRRAKELLSPVSEPAIYAKLGDPLRAEIREVERQLRSGELDGFSLKLDGSLFLSIFEFFRHAEKNGVSRDDLNSLEEFAFGDGWSEWDWRREYTDIKGPRHCYGEELCSLEECKELVIDYYNCCNFSLMRDVADHVPDGIIKYDYAELPEGMELEEFGRITWDRDRQQFLALAVKHEGDEEHYYANNCSESDRSSYYSNLLEAAFCLVANDYELELETHYPTE